jgi:hypothetical protein
MEKTSSILERDRMIRTTSPSSWRGSGTACTTTPNSARVTRVISEAATASACAWVVIRLVV